MNNVENILQDLRGVSGAHTAYADNGEYITVLISGHAASVSSAIAAIAIEGFRVKSVTAHSAPNNKYLGNVKIAGDAHMLTTLMEKKYVK